MAVKRKGIGFILQPWAGLSGGFAGWALHHQVVNDTQHFDCGVGNGTGLLLGLSMLLLIALSALWSRAVLRETERTAGSRVFVARLSLLAAALFALVVVVQVMAGLLLPGCRP